MKRLCLATMVASVSLGVAACGGDSPGPPLPLETGGGGSAQHDGGGGIGSPPVDDEGGALPNPTAADTLLVVAEEEAGPNGIAADGSHVYWSNWATGNVRRRALDLATPVETVFDGNGLGEGLQLFQGRLYGVHSWPVEPEQGTIWSYEAGAASPSPITADDGYARAIAVDASGVYWTAHDWTGEERAPGAIRRYAEDGTVATLLSASDGHAELAPSLALDSGYVYWADKGEVDAAPAGGVYRTDKASGASELFASAGGVRHVASQSGYLYFFDSSCALLRKDTAAAPTDPAELVLSDPLCRGPLVTDAERVFWVAKDGHYVSVRAVALDGGEVSTLGTAFGGFGSTSDMAVGDDHVFFAYGTDEGATVYAAPK